LSDFLLKYLVTGGLCQSHIGIIQVITDVRRFSEENLYYSEAIEANRLLHYITRLFKTCPFAGQPHREQSLAGTKLEAIAKKFISGMTWIGVM
jgi:hypothetical protein